MNLSSRPNTIDACDRSLMDAVAANSSLGRAGEDLVLRIEETRLIKEGRADLARKIEHTSVCEGDGAGFDIHSFEPDGGDRLIEVKTTGYSKSTPFFVTCNELTVSTERANCYHLYRIFNMRATPRLFSLQVALDRTCLLLPEVYKGRVA